MVLVGVVRWVAVTDSVSIAWESPAGETRPGVAVSIANPGSDCEPSSDGDLWYRSAAFGRWRLTHVGHTGDEAKWWELSGPSHDFTPACRGGDTGFFEVRVPPDVDWSPVAMCTPDDQCVELEIDLSDE